ncbi:MULTISPECIES: hypothetical protein, partial [unclassified Microcoleus]|uniref:hypothetical protein n=1 Tax=unclassified Microcoleus TaxID=2642155 RepID=UPI002FD624FE
RRVFSENNSGTNMILCQLNLDAFTLPAHLNLSVVSPNYLLVNNILPTRTEVIDRHRPQSMGSY